jgi:8-oxo-dGTP pyrophosphatase MutT (NUDIX family)
VRANNFVKEGQGWKTISTTRQFENDHVEVVTDIVRTPTQSEERSWVIVHRKPAVVIAPQREDGKFLLVRQERIPIRSTIWEMPAGQIDHTIEPHAVEIAEAALRELREETGHELAPGGEMIPLGHFFSSPGFTDEHCYFFLARFVQPCAEHDREEGEGILECRAFSENELRRMITESEIRDANTLSICARLAVRGFLALQPRE